MPHHDELEGNEGDLRVLMNTDVDRQGEYPSDLQGILSLERYRTVRDEIVSWPGYGATPLIALDSLAARLGISKLWYKDEGQRFTLQSFKALGGPFGVLQVLRQALRDRVPLLDAVVPQLDQAEDETADDGPSADDLGERRQILE